MEYKNFLLSFLLCSMLLTASYCYMIFEEKQNSDNYAMNNKIKIPDLPPISIVGIQQPSQWRGWGNLRSRSSFFPNTHVLISLGVYPYGRPPKRDLTKTSLKLSRKEAEKKKSMKRMGQQKKPSKPKPSPPPNCVATWASCKPPSHPCCDFCAFCHCRLFQTVCYCRMGNPNC